MVMSKYCQGCGKEMWEGNQWHVQNNDKQRSREAGSAALATKTKLKS